MTEHDIVDEAMQLFPEVTPASTPASHQGPDVQLRSQWINTINNAARMAFHDVFLGDGSAWRRAMLLIVATAIHGIKAYDARKN